MNKLQRMIWMDFFEPLWQNRNELLHQQKKNYERAEDAAVTKKLEWYKSNRHTLLAHHDHFLLHNINTTILHTMPPRQKREWIRHLTAAKLANTQELTLLKTNQRSLFRYMIPVNAPPTANPGTQPPRGEPNLPPEGRKEGRTNGQTTQNYARTDARMDGLADDLIENNSTNIIQPDTQQPHDNGTTGTKRSDGKTTSGGSSGYARRVLPRRILLHLPRKGRIRNEVLGHPPKLKVHNSPHMRIRVPRWSKLQPGKTPARRQWLLQGTPRQPVHSLYAHHIQGHTSQTSETTTDVRDKSEGEY